MLKTGKSPRAVVTGIELPKSPVDFFTTLQRHPFPFILDSALTNPRSGRTTLMGSNPFLVFTAKGDQISLWKEGQESRITGNPFDVLADLLEKYRVPPDPDVPFPGGAVGYLGYDLGRHLEKLPCRAMDDVEFPDLFVAFHVRLIVVDHVEGRSSIVDLGHQERPRALGMKEYENSPRLTRPVLSRSFSKEDYLAAI